MLEALGVGAASGPLLEQFSGYLAARLGLHFPPERHAELGRRLEEVARELGQPDAAACMRWLMSAPLPRERVEVLASHLTVGESYFLREPETFAALGARVLPALLRARAAERRLRIWSAGCSTGEEPYSIAVVLDRLGEALRGWDVTLLATDINPRFLRRAAEAVYGEWSFRGAPPWLKARYFNGAPDGRHALRAEVRARVSFGYLNLAEDDYPSLLTNTTALDLIVCRNVLMYFEPQAMAAAAGRLRDALAPDGWLILGAAEGAVVRPPGLRAEQVEGATLYQRARAEPAPVAASPPAPPRARLRRASRPAPPPLAPAAPATEAPLAQQARQLANAGKLDAALACSRRALAQDLLDPAAHYLHALIAREAGRAEEASASLRRVLFLDAEFVMAHFTLAGIALGARDYEGARRHLAAARTLLARRAPEAPVPGAEGMTAARLLRIVESMQEQADGAS